MAIDNKTVLADIAAHAEANGWTVAELLAVAKVNKSMLSRWRSNEFEPRPASLRRIFQQGRPSKASVRRSA